ncbi:hypothetical protein Tco_0896172 [Tanacetum coccineum]
MGEVAGLLRQTTKHQMLLILYMEQVLNSMLSQVKMDDPDITMEEYIQVEVEKARRHGQAFNWETATYAKDNNNDKIDVELCSEIISTKPLDGVIDADVDTYSQEFNGNLETNHDIPGKSFTINYFVIMIKVVI